MWIEVNDESRGTYNVNSQLTLKLQCEDYSDAYTLVSATLTFSNTEAAGAAANNREKMQ